MASGRWQGLEQLRKAMTRDRGKGLSGHAQFTLDTGTRVL